MQLVFIAFASGCDAHTATLAERMSIECGCRSGARIRIAFLLLADLGMEMSKIE